MKFLAALSFALFSVLSVQAQYSIAGKVVDEKGDPLPGANVYLENANLATAADGSGNFRLEGVPAGTYQLKASYVGYTAFSQPIQVDEDLELTIELDESVLRGEEVIVYSTRAHEKTPTTYTNVSNEEIEERNMGQDLPFVLRFTPSTVVTSDAGAGVGYTGIRIRGSDPTRINVTVNGIPLNDSESHGVFWVNMPDFASSVNNVQIQRGVGTSTNGAAAFGATINMQTEMPSQDAYGKIVNGYGSFDTWRHTIEYNTGLINDLWSFQGRLSQISSDGYIDRASSDLKSYYLAGGFYGKNTTVKALTFGGKEITYQSWYGTPEAVLEGDAEDIEELIAFGGEYTTDEQLENLYNADRTFNYYLYENEVDNYQQDHYQLHLNHIFNQNFNITASGHYTYGRGYYEQYRPSDDFSDYGLPNVTIGDSTITSTDLIRRRWLDNHFYGVTWSANYVLDDVSLIFGGAWNKYEGDHFGEIIWAQYASTSEIGDRYYDNVAEKDDFNVYLKGNFQLGERINLFADAQVRKIDYYTIGIDNDLRAIAAGDDYLFFNPKLGLTYTLDDDANIYASYAISNREPVRTDFIDAPEGTMPEHETLRNLEVGYRRTAYNYSFSANYYLMDYENQLVLTGAVNDVGSTIRTNVPDSYRTGIELVGGVRLLDNLEVAANLTLSQNKIADFTEVVYDYGEAFDEYNIIENEYENTDISFSPNVIAGGQLSYHPVSDLQIIWFSKYVGQQYLDNTSNESRSIDAYFINDLKVDYSFGFEALKDATLSFMVNNILDVEYSSNGYTWGYYYGPDNLYQQNNYYPQAGINFLASLSLTF